MTARSSADTRCRDRAAAGGPWDGNNGRPLYISNEGLSSVLSLCGAAQEANRSTKRSLFHGAIAGVHQQEHRLGNTLVDVALPSQKTLQRIEQRAVAAGASLVKPDVKNDRRLEESGDIRNAVNFCVFLYICFNILNIVPGLFLNIDATTFYLSGEGAELVVTMKDISKKKRENHLSAAATDKAPDANTAHLAIKVHSTVSYEGHSLTGHVILKGCGDYAAVNTFKVL